MNIPDMINGSFEAGAVYMLGRNCWMTYKAKEVKGVSIVSTAFFSAWGYWNMYLYSSLALWFSWISGIGVALVNTFWVCQMIYYNRKKSKISNN